LDKHGLKPHRLQGYLASTTPNLKPRRPIHRAVPESAAACRAVFLRDEKTAIQAPIARTVLPLSPGRAEAHGFEYFRHGTLSLYAAFTTKTGAVLGNTADRHTSAEFVAF